MHETQLETQKQNRQRRSSGSPAPIRELQRMVEASMAKLAEFAKEEGEKLARKGAEAVEAVRLAEAQERDDFARIRAILNTASGGGAERFLRASSQITETDREFMREKGWRV